MPYGYERYRLSTGNPYKNRELNPLESGADAELLFTAPGYLQKEEIEAVLQSAVDKKKYAFFLIAGKSGAGRTSTAKFILYKYREIRGIDPRHFVVPEYEMNDSVTSVLKNWAVYLRTGLEDQDIPMGNAEKLLKELSGVDEETFVAEFKIALKRASNILAATEPQAGFGVLLEKVRSTSVLTECLKAFSSAQTAVVMTVDDYATQGHEVLNKFDEREERKLAQPINLRELEAGNICKLAHLRWGPASNSPPPFEYKVIETGFNKLYTIGRSLDLLERLIEDKLIGNQDGPPWPEAEDLGFQEEEIAQKLKLWGRRLR